MMNEETYRTWWPLHLRVVRGESLTAKEQAAYTAGLRQLHQEEILHEDVAILHRTRATVVALEAEQAQLRAQQERLEAEIATLEGALSESTRHILGVKG